MVETADEKRKHLCYFGRGPEQRTRNEMAHGEGLTCMEPAHPDAIDRLLLWLTGPFALAREAPERPLHEPSGPAQSTAAPLHSEDTTSTTR